MLKTLMWKDYRQNRKVMAGVGVFILTPYIFTASYGILESIQGREIHGGVKALLAGGAGWSIILLTLMSAFLAGNAFAGERSERSAEFFAYLPISRTRSVLSRGLVLFLVLAVCISVNIAIIAAAYDPRDRELLSVLKVCAPTMILLLGVAWMWSAILRSPAIAAALGIGTAMLLGGMLSMVASIRNLEAPETWIKPVYVVCCLAIGLPAILVGIIVGLKRIEP